MGTSWIDPDTGGSHDYASVTAWLADIDNLADETQYGELGPTSGSADNPSDSIGVSYSGSRNATLQAKEGYKHTGVPGTSPTHARVHQTATSTTNDHLFIQSDDFTVFDLDLRSDSTESSAELFRNSYAKNLTVKRTFMGFSGNTDQQDCVYVDYDSQTFTLDFESCTFYDIGRSVVDLYAVTSSDITVNFAGCASYNIGANGARSDGCWTGATGSNSTTITVNAFNNLCSVDDTYVFTGDHNNANATILSDYNITNTTNFASDFDTETDTGTQVSKTFVEGDPASGEVGLIETGTSPYDLKIYDDPTHNLAGEFHSVATGANSGLAIPADITNTSRSGEAPYDCGIYEIVAGGGDLTIDTSQSINLSELVHGQLSVAGINIFENINLTESVTISDLLLDITIDLSEQLNLSEFVSTSMNLGAISINETVNLAEALTSGVPLAFSRFENITLTEFLSLLETIAPSAFENITVTEFLSLLKDIGLSEFESITVNELIVANLESSGVDVSEAIELSEFVSILKDIGVDMSQQITITEVIAGIISLAGISTGEDITINEAVLGILSVAGIDTSQSINVSEYVELLRSSDFGISGVVENLTITEALSLLFSHIPVSEIQNINISEFVQALLTTTGIDVSDTINLSEAITLLVNLATISVSDSVTLVEAVTALLETTGASVYDTININEYIQGILEITGISVSDSVTLSEFIIVTMVTVAGIMKVNFSVRRPSVGFQTRKPKITFN